MKRYRVKLSKEPNGSGSSMEMPYLAYSEFHAMQMAQKDWPTWYAVSAYSN